MESGNRCIVSQFFWSLHIHVHRVILHLTLMPQIRKIENESELRLLDLVYITSTCI